METLTTVPAHENEIEKEEDETAQTLEGLSFTTLDHDVILNHIITRLDVATLTALTCTSSELRRLCSNELWRKICTDIWPSLLDPIASDVISTFPGGYRSLFSDAFPSIQHDGVLSYLSPPPLEMICAVDIYCQQGPAFFSRVQRINRHESFVMNFYKVNASVFVPVKGKLNEWFQENLRLSWIVIDPSRKRAANLFSGKPVRSCLSRPRREFVVKYGVVMTGKKVNCHVKVRCRWSPGRNKLRVRSVEMKMLDMNDWPVVGREAFMIMQNVMQNGERKISDAKEKFSSERKEKTRVD